MRLTASYNMLICTEPILSSADTHTSTWADVQSNLERYSLQTSKSELVMPAVVDGMSDFWAWLLNSSEGSLINAGGVAEYDIN